MKDNRLEQRIQHSLNAELSGLNTTSWQRNQFFENATGGTKVKRKLTYSLVLAIVLLLIAATALAVTISYINGQKHIEKAMDISVEFDKYSEWDLDAKIRLIESMREDGIEVSESNWEALHGTDLSEEKKNVLADEILTEQYGEGEYLWFYTIATVDWGEPQTWNLEQRYWFFKTMREKGLYGDYSWIDLLPEDGDLTQEQAENIAKKAVEEAFDLSEEEMTHLHGDVAFFITDECSTPRWQVCLYKDQNVWSTEYTVLLTREGEVTEDPEGLGVWTPVHERQRREERQKVAEYSATEWEKNAQMRLNEHDDRREKPSDMDAYERSIWKLAGYNPEESASVDTPYTRDGQIVGTKVSRHCTFDDDGTLLGLQDENAPWLSIDLNNSRKYVRDEEALQQISDRLVNFLETVNPGMSKTIREMQVDWEQELDGQIWIKIDGIPKDENDGGITFVVRLEPDWQIQYFSCTSNG